MATDAPATKPIAERVQESLHILKQLQDLGVLKNCQGYLALKERCNDWIKGGPAWKGHIDFYEYDRRAQVLLPIKLNTKAKCDFLIYKFDH